MPRYFFHTEDGECIRDEDGTELKNHHEARNEAVVVLGEVVRADPERFWRDGTFRLTVADEDGLILYVLDLSAVQSATIRRPSDQA